jgi:hypothetical protein
MIIAATRSAVRIFGTFSGNLNEFVVCREFVFILRTNAQLNERPHRNAQLRSNEMVQKSAREIHTWNFPPLKGMPSCSTQ